MNEPRIFEPQNWKPLERWLPPGQRKEFALIWRQGDCEYYRYSKTGKYPLLDQFEQCYRNNNDLEDSIPEVTQ